MSLSSTIIQPTKFQSKVLRYRDEANILNGGGRGSGKTTSLIFDLLDLCAHPAQRPLVTRESWSGLQELQEKIFSWAIVAFGSRCQRNKSDGTITLPNGNVITFTNVGDDQSYAKLQGRTFTALYADELGNYPPQAFRYLQLVMSNLRVPPGHRPRMHFTANPHGRSHTKIVKQWINQAPPWKIFPDAEGDRWVVCTSSLEDNPHIDREAYKRSLLKSVGGDKALATAWIEGDWAQLGGVMFDMWDPQKHIISAPPNFNRGRYRIGADWGTASPSTGILLVRLREPSGRYRAGDVIALDETDTAYPDDLTMGSGIAAASWGEMLQEMINRNGRRKVAICTDDARGLQGDTVVEELRSMGMIAYKPYNKNRTGNWLLIRQMLQAAVDGSDRPALWVSNKCTHLIATLPEAPRYSLRPEDIDPKWNEDHWLDGLAYGLKDLCTQSATSGRTRGHY